MPMRASHECHFSGCHVTTRNKYCDEHKNVMRVRTRHRRRHYATPEYQANRAMALARAKGCCQDPDHEGPRFINDPRAVHADHVVAVQDGGTDQYTNLMIRCRSCHSRKTLKERRNRGERI